MVAPYIRLLRPKHWIKNLFIFIPIFFAGEFFKVEKLIVVFWGFACFSLIASSIYIINDTYDAEEDRQHPKKKNRPIASGQVSKKSGLILSTLLTSTGLGLAYYMSVDFFYLLFLYFVLNIAYTIRLKNISILDLLIVAAGFMIRVLSGGILAKVLVTQWTVIMVLLLALFLVMAKRRDDFVISDGNHVIRKSSSQYNLEFVNLCLTMLSGIIIVSYIMFTLSNQVINKFGSEYLYLTCIFVIAGVMRYLQLAIVEQNTGSPTNILYKDRFIIVTLVLWVISFFVIIY